MRKVAAVKKAVWMLLIAALFLAAFLSVPGPAASAETEEAFLTEIVYNDFLLQNSSIRRNIQFYFNLEALREGLDGTETEALNARVAAAFAAIRLMFSDAGYTSKTYESYVEVTLEEYGSYTDMYIAYDIDGYDNSPSTAVKKAGFAYNVYTTARKTIFANMGEESLIRTGIALMETAAESSRTGYIYNYGTKYSDKAVQSDADRTFLYSNLNITVHQFRMSAAETDREIHIIQRSPNPLTWYGLTVLAVLIAAGVSIYFAVKAKKKSGEGKGE